MTLQVLSLPDGRRIFRGLSSQQAALVRAADPKARVVVDDQTAALRAGDLRKAASLGASAADIVRALQAKGRFKNVEPTEAVVSIDAAGNVEVTPMKPLPALGSDTAGGQTVGLGGTGFSFQAKPGTIILYPNGATSFGPPGPNGAPAGTWTAAPKPQSDSGRPGIIPVSDPAPGV